MKRNFLSKLDSHHHGMPTDRISLDTNHTMRMFVADVMRSQRDQCEGVLCPDVLHM